jgi:ribonuclease-3
MGWDELTNALGHRFGDKALLRVALTHRSFGTQHNERLEFLGDSVLNCVIADELYRRFPQLAEGELSRARALLVRQQSLYERAQGLGLGAELLLGEGELRSGGTNRPSILADALEAMIGAVYVDGGFERARAVVCRLFASALEGAEDTVLGKDPKTLLQEYLQSKRLPLPQYTIVATHGEAHCQHFTVACAIPSMQIQAIGEGRSRRAAEQSAAESAYRQATGS